ncbi:MAG: polyphenol oxidase [Rhodospirillaceae bacterium]|nr:polyphenol oxidase [Rhodospirillaceae bacterium]
MTDPVSQILTDQELSFLRGIRHGFFTRNGGVSNGIYASLNAGYGSNDETSKVTENRQLIIDSLGATSLNSVSQVHGKRVERVYGSWAKGATPRADAMVTNKPGMAIGILSADCAPILFCDPKARIIGAAHAGWRGALAGVVEATIDEMCEIGAQSDSIIAAIGPTIGPRSYEVSEKFLKPFLDQNQKNAVFFREASRAAHFLFDLPGYITSLMKDQGLDKVSWTGHDTYADNERFFSYRYGYTHGQSDYGRMLSAIMIEK